MKKILILSLGVILFTSCDPAVYYDYYIINNCNEGINISLIDYNDKSYSFYINAKTEQLVYHDEAINSLEERMVEIFIKNITIIKENDTSKINYVNKSLWEFRINAKDHADIYLTIRPEDFE